MTQHRLVDQENTEDVEYDEILPHQRWTLALDTDGDLHFNSETKTFDTIHGTDSIVQTLKVALGTVKSEDPVDEEYGLDVFSATRSYRHLEREVRRTLLHDDINHDRVEGVTNVDIFRRGHSRQAHVEIEVQLDTGQLQAIEFDLGATL